MPNSEDLVNEAIYKLKGFIEILDKEKMTGVNNLRREEINKSICKMMKAIEVLKG